MKILRTNNMGYHNIGVYSQNNYFQNTLANNPSFGQIHNVNILKNQVKTQKRLNTTAKLSVLGLDAAGIAMGSLYAGLRMPFDIAKTIGPAIDNFAKTHNSKNVIADLLIDAKSGLATQEDMIIGLKTLELTEDFGPVVTFILGSAGEKIQDNPVQRFKDESMRILFPQIDNSPNGHRAKVSYLNHLIDTGEYVDSDYFIHAFRELPEYKYLWEKLTILKTIINDNEVYENLIDKECKKLMETEYKEFKAADSTYEKYGNALSVSKLVGKKGFKNSVYLRNKACDEINKRRIMLVASLIGSMYAEETLPNAIREELTKFAQVALVQISQKLLFTEDGLRVQNRLYDFYSNAFQMTNDGKNKLSIQEQIIALDYIENVMNIENMKGVNVGIDEDLFDDMKKDYIIWHDLISPDTEFSNVKNVIDERIEEKRKSDNADINNSIAGFIFLTGFAQEYNNIKGLDKLKCNPNPIYNDFKILDTDNITKYTNKHRKQSVEIREIKILKANAKQDARNEVYGEISAFKREHMLDMKG